MADWAIFDAAGKLLGQLVMDEGVTPTEDDAGQPFAKAVQLARQIDLLTEDVHPVSGMITLRRADRDRILRHDQFTNMTRGELVEWLENMVDEKIRVAIATAGGKV